MSKNKRPVITDDFKNEVVRLIVTSRRTISQIAGDLGGGLSTLSRWNAHFMKQILWLVHMRI